MSGDWQQADVELVDGYTVVGADGVPVRAVSRALVALEGGFAKLRLPGTDTVQVVSAPAVRLISYRS